LRERSLSTGLQPKPKRKEKPTIGSSMMCVGALVLLIGMLASQWHPARFCHWHQRREQLAIRGKPKIIGLQPLLKLQMLPAVTF
jgi:hypothetical protein